MRAIVVDQPGRMRLTELDMPNAGPGEVLIRSQAAGICGTDLKILHGSLPGSVVRYPCIPGHEWTGTIGGVGEGVNGLSPGERVVCEGRIPCGSCSNCRRGDTNLCANYRQLGFTLPGGYAEYAVVPRPVVHSLPAGMTFQAGVLIEPASCVLRGLERARAAPGDAIGVIGIGTLGSIALLLARLYGPRMVVAFGIRPDELALAADLGADQVIDVSGEDPESALRRLVGDGLDLVLETAGAVPAIELATRMVRPGGRICILGSAGEGETLELPADRLMRKDLALFGNLSYTTATWTRMLALASGGLVDLGRLVSHRFPLEAFAEAFGLLERPVGMVAKIVLEHGAGV